MVAGTGAGNRLRACQGTEVPEGTVQAQKRHVEEEMVPWYSPLLHFQEGLPPTWLLEVTVCASSHTLLMSNQHSI